MNSNFENLNSPMKRISKNQKTFSLKKLWLLLSKTYFGLYFRTRKNTGIESDFVSNLISNNLKFFLPIFTRTKEYSLSKEEIEIVYSKRKHVEKIEEEEKELSCHWNKIVRKLYSVIFPGKKKPEKIHLYDLAKNIYDFSILPKRKIPKKRCLFSSGLHRIFFYGKNFRDVCESFSS